MCIRDRSYAGVPYSAFTLALIEALSGEGASKQDGFVRLADLALYAREPVSYTHLRAHETVLDLVCRLLLEKKNLSLIHLSEPTSTY